MGEQNSARMILRKEEQMHTVSSPQERTLANTRDLTQAPDVQLVGSTYVLYYAVSTFGSQASAIGYATSSTMEAGSWTDHGSTGIASSSGKAYNAIDPNLIKVGSSYYMNFGSFWGDIYQVCLLQSRYTLRMATLCRDSGPLPELTSPPGSHEQWCHQGIRLGIPDRV
jgi:hypothetical protein